jgi:hypothetical protein
MRVALVLFCTIVGCLTGAILVLLFGAGRR